MSNLSEKLQSLYLDLFTIDCLKFGQFKLPSNIVTNAYFDLVVVLSYPKVMDNICNLMKEFLSKNNVVSESICGVSYSGIPFASLLSHKINLPLLLRYKETVFHSNEGRIYGNIIKYSRSLVVEEVLCSGFSTLEVIKDLENENIVVEDIVTIIDLGQGGVENLNKLGYRVHTLCKLSEMGRFLYESNKINSTHLENIRDGWHAIFAINGDCITDTMLGLRRTLSYNKRIEQLKSKISMKLFKLMIDKKTNLCINLSTSDINTVLTTAKLIGPYIAILTLPMNLFEKFYSDRSIKELKQVSIDYNFLIMDYGKLSENGPVLFKQLSGLFEFVDIVTLLPLNGDSSIIEYNNFMNNFPDKGFVIVTSVLTKDSLLGSDAESKIITLTLEKCENVCGFISHRNSLIPPNYVHLMPDMMNTKSTVQTNKNNYEYYTPKMIVSNIAADVVIINLDYSLEIEKLKNMQVSLWNAYMTRIGEKKL